MHFLTAAALWLALAAPSLAQTAPAADPTPPASVGAAPACAPRQANLGGVGRAAVVGFTGAIFGDRVCATVANLALDAVAARIAAAPPDGALAVAALPPAASGGADGAALVLAGDSLSVVAGGAPPTDGGTSAPVGPFVVAPGGRIPAFADDAKAEPRVVLAFAGQRLLLIGLSPVALGDLARALREQPDLFGADAIERAVVLSSGGGASLALQTADGPLGTAQVAARYLVLIKRS